MSAQEKNNKLEALASLCKRRGFIFQTSEIYGGLNGFWDYGPMGAELKRNIKDAWWKAMVHEREDIVGLDSAIIQHPRTWEASGHLEGFTDPMVDCRETQKRYRADQVFVLAVPQNPDAPIFAYSDADGEMIAYRKLDKWVTANHKPVAPKPGVPLMSMPLEDFKRIVGPDATTAGTLTNPRKFNLMFKTFVGPTEDTSTVAYLRPETAQGIFAQYNNVLACSRVKVPFGIAQIGKAFRNEINPRNYTFRSREFEQMELEFFVKPGSDAEWHEYWVAERLKWYSRIGLPEGHLHRYVYGKDELAHYASACVDVLYDFPFGTQELEGIAARGDFDLSRHQQFSGKSMEYFDQDTKEKFVPHVVEPSAGTDRIALALLCEAFHEEWVPTSEVAGSQPIPVDYDNPKQPQGCELRTVLRFAPCIAPIKVAVFPLLKNKPDLVNKARGVFDTLRKRWSAFWDVAGAIGRRYRRQDEIGTPFGVTVDFQTLEDDTVTLRERDSMQQVRVKIGELPERLAVAVEG